MNNDKLVPIRKKIIFTAEAEKRWNLIPKVMQVRILNTVWCSACGGTASMIIESSKLERKDLILRGKCKACGHEVCRLIEPEEE